MKGAVVLLLALVVAAAAVAVSADAELDTQCQNWVSSNQKDVILMGQVAGQSKVDSCKQFCMVADAGVRGERTTCRELCDIAGVSQFSKALASTSGHVSSVDVCASMLAKKEAAGGQPLSLLEVGSQSRASEERKLGVRGDMTIQGTLETAVLTSPVGDVKVSGSMTVMNQVESASARAAFIKSDTGVSVKSGIVPKKEQLLIKGKIDADSVTAEGIQSSFLEIDGVRQWSLHSIDDFEEVGADGWSSNELTECAGRKVLGGHCAGEKGVSVTKTYSGLPPHNQVRISAQYLFIDSWDGESGFLKVDGNVVWAEAYHHGTGDASHGINLCGNPTPERKFARPVDVTVPHTGASFTLEFGATTDEHPCDESFGIDSVMIFTR